MPEKILIAGGTGFIGSHLANYAIKNGFEVDILSLHPPTQERKVEGVRYISVDLSDLESIRQKLPEQPIDYVVNLSGYIDHSPLLEGGRMVIDSHLIGMLNLIQVIDHKHLKRFVQIGSSDEYGNQPAPQNEDMFVNPISPYSFSKSASTQLLQMLYRTESFPATILRLFLVYGPGQDNTRFLPQIIQGCLSDSTFAASSGEQLRDFCFVSDIVEGIFLSLKCDKVNGQVINIGSGKAVSIKEIINYVQKKIGIGQPEFGKIPYRVDENMKLYADISKAKSLLGWEAKVEFEAGIQETIEYYR